MPGNTLRFADTPIEAGKLLFASFGGFGVLPAELPTTGEHGPSFLLDDIDPGDENTEIRPRITAVPSAGTFTADEYGRFELADAPPGAYTFRYRPIVGVTVLGEATETIVNGEPMLVQFAGVLPTLEWSGAAEMLQPTPVQFAAVLPGMEWAGAVVSPSPFAVAFAAEMAGLVWAGEAALQPATVSFSAQLPTLEWAGDVASLAPLAAQFAAVAPALAWSGLIVASPPLNLSAFHTYTVPAAGVRFAVPSFGTTYRIPGD